MCVGFYSLFFINKKYLVVLPKNNFSFHKRKIIIVRIIIIAIRIVIILIKLIQMIDLT